MPVPHLGFLIARLLLINPLVTGERFTSMHHSDGCPGGLVTGQCPGDLKVLLAVLHAAHRELYGVSYDLLFPKCPIDSVV